MCGLQILFCITFVSKHCFAFVKNILKVILVCFVVLLSAAYESVAQGELDEQHKIFFRNEKTYAFELNSDGWGANYRYGKRNVARDKFLVEFDFNIIKHDKEGKVLPIRDLRLKRIVFGKINSVFDLQLSYGYQYELFEKADKGSVSVRAFGLAGGTLAFLKPIYYDVERGDGTGRDTILFHSEIPFHLIYGSMPYYYGIGKMKFLPGAFAKVGIGVDFSKLDNKVNTLEAGVALQVYPKKLEIMLTDTNKQILPTVFLSYRFGKVVSGYHLKKQDEGTY